MVDQLKGYYITRSKLCRWIMVVLSYMLDKVGFNGKTVQCWKNNSNISSTSSYDFNQNLEKTLALQYVQRRRLNGLASSVQLRIKIFLRVALLVDEPLAKLERRFTGTGQRRRCQLHMTNCPTKTEKEQYQKIS